LSHFLYSFERGGFGMKRRLPKDYSGTETTGRHIAEVLPAVLRKMGAAFQDRPDLVLATWPQIIGGKLSSMTQAVSFEDGLLFVKVKNSSLYSLLSQHERPRLLRSLREKFPSVTIRNIIFRMG
jgi:hypothetical protein